VNRRRFPILVALAAAVLFGAATPANKILLATLPPFQLAGLLYLGAALVMLPSVLRQDRPVSQLDARNRRRLLGSVVAGGMVAPVLLLAGLRLASAASVSLLLNLEMAATAVLGALVFSEPLGRSGWIGAVGIVAAGAILSGGAWPGILAAVFVAGACVCWGLDNHLTALIDVITPTLSTFWKGGVAGGANLAIGIAVTPLTATPWAIATALLIGALAYGASIVLYIRAAHQLGAVRSQAIFASAPFIGAALSYGLLGEPFAPSAKAAAVLLVGSASLLFGGLHVHTHAHQAVEHTHSHRHDDEHHNHDHGDATVTAQHAHRHQHDAIMHAHPHWPDLHHRHDH